MHSVKEEPSLGVVSKRLIIILKQVHMHNLVVIFFFSLGTASTTVVKSKTIETTEQLRELIKCPVCYNSMNGEDHKPRILTCGHKCCEPCLNKINPPLHCPVCRAPCETNIDRLPFCFTTIHLSTQVPTLLDLSMSD